MTSTISVVIPVYNSEKTLTELCRRLIMVLTTLTSEYEVILVDDGSVDRSFEKMLALHAENPRIKLIQLAGNFGQQNALMCGFHYVTGDMTVTLDDDLQHPPEEIPRLIQALNDGYEVVFGIPVVKQHSGWRNLGSKLTAWVLNHLTAKAHHIQVSSFRGLTRRVIAALLQDAPSFIYLAPLIFRITQRIASVPVRHEPRRWGRSNYNYIKLIILWVKLVVYYSKLGCWLPRNRRPQYQVKRIYL